MAIVACIQLLTGQTPVASELVERPAKRMHASAGFVPQLTHIVALCEDRLPLIFLCNEVFFTQLILDFQSEEIVPLTTALYVVS